MPIDGDGGFDGYIEDVKQAVIKWRSEEPSVLGQAGSVITAPVGWLISKFIPTEAVLGVLAGFDWVAKNIVTAPASVDRNDLRACDAGANQVQNFHIGLGIAGGGAAGTFGLAGIAADLPTVLAIALRLVRQVGVEYGYLDDNEIERAFCLSVLAAAGANTLKSKAASHLLLHKIAVMLMKRSWKDIAAAAVVQAIGVEAGIIGAKRLAKELGINLTKRKALQAIPIIGAAVGAASNGWFIRDIGVTAQRAFQERWLIERGHLLIDRAGEDT